MKFLIVAFLTVSSISSYSCSTKTVAELNSCKVKDRWQQILKSIRPAEEYVISPRLDINDDRGAFQRLSMNNKPTLSEFNNELARWKSELRPKIKLSEDLSSIKWGPLAAFKCGFSKSNHALLLKEIREGMDQEKVDCMKSKQAEIMATIQKRKDDRESASTLRDEIKSYDCETVSGDYLKKICELNKLKP